MIKQAAESKPIYQARVDPIKRLKSTSAQLWPRTKITYIAHFRAKRGDWVLQNPPPRWSVGTLKRALADRIFGFSFRVVIEQGKWRGAFTQTLAPRPGESILELSGDGGIFTSSLAEVYPETRFTIVDWDCSRKLNVMLNSNTMETLRCDNFQIMCKGGGFDKAIISWALHLLQDNQKVRLLHEMRRVLRRGGTLHVIDYDRPEHMLERAGLAYASRQYGFEAIRAHFDGTWIDAIGSADFADVRRMTSCHEISAHVATVRARRRL